MTSAEKVAKAKDILNSNPSAEDKSIAVGLAQEAAAENDHEGLYIMARLYHEGVGVEQNFEKSFDLCQKALAAGSEKVKTLLAIYYMVGNVVERNIPLAEQYLRDGMAQNHGFAYFIMGDFVFQDVFPYIEWTNFASYFEKAIELGESGVIVRLAEKYNLICELDKAEYWYSKAEEYGIEGVAESRAQFTEYNYTERRNNILAYYVSRNKYDEAIALVNRDAAMGDITARYLQAAQYVQGLGDKAHGRNLQKGLTLYEQLAEEGESQANCTLGQLYYYVKEIKDLQKALNYIQKAADADNPKALFILATNYLGDKEIETQPEYDLGLGKDEVLGMQMLHKAAEADNPQALFSMSLCYSLGKYLMQNDEQAFIFLERSVQEEATAEKVTMLAGMYKDGKGIEQDYEKAVACYQWATDNGSFAAASQLASMYHEGKGVEQNDEMANRLVLHSKELMQWQLFDIMPLEVVLNEAEKGNPTAMFQLGCRYHIGDGVEQDIDKAVEWWQKSHKAGNIESTHNLGCYYLQEDESEKGIKYLNQSSAADYILSYHALGEYYLSHVEKEGFIQKGISSLTTSAEQGYAPSQWDLVSIYYNSEIIPNDYNKARYWLEKCLDSDYPKSHYGMGKCLFYGDMYEQDYAKALEHLRMAVTHSVHEADALYIQLRWFGNGVDSDHDEVVKVFTTLAESNDAIAMWQLYLFYTDESYEKHDTAKAIDYLKQSVSQGYIDAIEQLAWHYYWGEGVERDVHLAIELYALVAEEGNLEAAVKLARIYIVGEDDVIAPDYDKAIDLLQPHLGNDGGEAEYLMAHAVRCKCDMKNAYSWELAEQAFNHMQRAAEKGHVDAMYNLAQYYMEGYGVFAEDNKNEKLWLQKYIDNGGTLMNEENPTSYSDEAWADYSRLVLVNNIKTIVEANIERIENPLEMVIAEDYLRNENVLLNAVQLGEVNALFSLGFWGLNELKTNTEKAKKYISAACKYGMPDFACRAGMDWLEEGLDNETAIESAMEYFSMGAEQGSVDCYLQMGLFCTDKRLEDEDGYSEALTSGKKILQVVANVEGEDYEEQRQQARARLAEIEQRPKSAWSKIKKVLGSIFGKNSK